MATSNLILLTACLLLSIVSVYANYHVSRYDFYSVNSEAGATQDFEACPSNYYKCKCYNDDDRLGFISQDPPSLSSFFTIKHLCGYSQLNHYLNNDGTYSSFVNNGDGKEVARCYGADTGKRTLECHAFDGTGNVYDYLICYGHPCEP